MLPTTKPWPTASVTLRAVSVACLLACAGLAHAQNPLLDEVVVTATRSEQRLKDVLADVTVIDRATIAQSGVTGLADVLARQPGIEMARNGGPGTTTSVFMRGGETRHTAVFIDGVRVDSQATGGAPWEAIPLSMIDRIEVVRGPAAAVYGSDAVNGVIQIFTRRGEQGEQAPTPFVSAGLGNHGTRDASAGISGGANGWDYALDVGYERSSGFNAISDPATWGYNPDKDGYRRSSGHASLGYRINSRHRIAGTYLGSYLNSGYDASADADDRSKNRLRTGNLAWQAQWSEQYSTLVSVSDSRTEYETAPSPYSADTNVRSYLFQNDLRIGAHHLTALLERRQDSLVSAPIDRKRSQNALALGYALNVGAHALQAQVRYDDDSEFGGETTGSVAYGLTLSPQWRAHVSAARAFRAPTLYQRFSDSGVADLKPEVARNVEAGITYAQGAHLLSLTAYRNNLTNLISYGAAGPCESSWGCYENTARAQYKGVTLAGQTRMGAWSLQGSLDWQKPTDRTTGNLLAGRAKRHGFLRAEYAMADWLFGAELQASASRWDASANTRRLGGYALWNLSATHTLGQDWTLVGRIDNVGDKPYAVVHGYATPGRSVYLGVKWAPER
ncbi:TonB-dependent receptor [Lampropedia cohaerens]|uniref:TonB-dependent receptor n=1 Tax=Lampropedia cohaerens TaxID=1610491 RepID=A0A0U1Q2B4_9BURK|nr:TonB-dependent receptor [Lampropedia cohaerens]KKW68893.1 TonB-dependent receptor [Lampropedia cohaerens]